MYKDAHTHTHTHTNSWKTNTPGECEYKWQSSPHSPWASVCSALGKFQRKRCQVGNTRRKSGKRERGREREMPQQVVKQFPNSFRLFDRATREIRQVHYKLNTKSGGRRSELKECLQSKSVELQLQKRQQKYCKEIKKCYCIKI